MHSSIPPSSTIVDHGHTPPRGARETTKLALAALGVVYGDIGTSPLYALRECLGPAHGLARSEANVLGILSLVVWSLVLVIVVKYLSFIMRADNQGEGGVLALLALISRKGASSRGRMTLLLMGLFGAALLYGDGVITPAISVLSAVEGLGTTAHGLERFVVPLTVAILVGLFLAQRRGTAGVGAIFGPVTLLWFVTLVATGLPWVVRHPYVLQALSPHHAVSFFVHNGFAGFLTLSSVVLCITGGEALYADMGHFGKRPIRLAWYAVVFPALLVNYFGQGALLLEHADVENPFFELVTGWLRYPITGIATAAAVVASQALISGAFSLTQQAVQLGYCPRFTIVHTSGKTEGQIYVPEVNAVLAVACVGLVVAFKRSTNLAGAYGIAVTGTMAITSILFYRVVRDLWGWPRLGAAALVAGFLVVDFAFFGANLFKVAEGGWFPIAVGLCVFTLMTTWHRGRAALAATIKDSILPLDVFLADVAARKPPRVSGTAVFMTPSTEGTPPVLLHQFKHNKVLHRQVVLLSIVTRRVPEVAASDRLAVTHLEEGFFRMTASYGFMETPDVQDLLRSAASHGLHVDLSDTTYFLGRETLLVSGRARLSRWRKRLFVIMSRNAQPATAFFRLPPNRVVEIGTQIEL